MNSGVIVQGRFVAHAIAAPVFEFEPPFEIFSLQARSWRNWFNCSKYSSLEIELSCASESVVAGGSCGADLLLDRVAFVFFFGSVILRQLFGLEMRLGLLVQKSIQRAP